jgi:hypothetical protein
MARLLRTIALMTAVGLGTLLVSSDSADARPRGRYWGNYWNWYDNSYRPYHYRYNYRYSPYGYNYNYRYYRPYGSYYRPYGNYYYRGYYPNRVQVGPLRFGWR